MVGAPHTHGSQDPSDFLQNRPDVFDRTQDQSADDNVHRLVANRGHVFRRHHQEVVVAQVGVCVHAQSQVPLEVRVWVGAHHGATVGVKPEVGPAATADLQQAEGAVCVGELGQTSKEFPFGLLHLLIVRKRDVVCERGKQASVQPSDAHEGQGPGDHMTEKFAYHH